MADFTSIKDAGNAEFKKENWAAARDFYTQALALDSQSEAAATIRSNRSASLLKLGEYDLALVDAEECTKLRPSWSKGWARVGEAQAHLHAFTEAGTAYTRAKTLAEDSAARQRYSAAVASMESRMRAISRNAMSQPGIQIGASGQMWFDRLEQEQRQGYVLVPGSAAELALYSYQSSCAGFGELQANLKVLPTGMMVGNKGTQSLHEINESLLSEPLGFIIRSGYDQLINKAIRFQIHAYGIEEAAQVGMSPKDTIAWFESRRDPNNWTPTRMPLTIILKSALILGFISSKFGDIGGGLSHYRRALGLIAEGNRVWPNADFQEKGTMFSYTFVRASKVLLMQCIEAGHQKAKTSTTKGGSYKLNEIESLALEIIADCEQTVAPGAGFDVGHTAYQIMPHVRALASLAYVYKESALKSARASKAAEAFDQAASLIPKDHPDHPILAYHALYYRLRAGGLTVGKIFDLAARAERAMATPERIFGPTTREFESRTFVRIQCQGLRDWMGGPDARVSHDDPLDATVKPVPTVYAKLKKGDEWVPMSFWLRWPQWNVGLMDVRGR